MWPITRFPDFGYLAGVNPEHFVVSGLGKHLINMPATS